MPGSPLVEADWQRVSARIAETMGLQFPPERWGDLRRGLVRVAEELGFADVAACGEWLSRATPNKAQMQVLASQLTVGETYFFRDKKVFEAVATHVIPELVRERRTAGRRLRIWSAACCTGEEPYSLAILLAQVIPDLADWHVTILATDLNEVFLQKAATGIYSEWSFRDAPPGFQERYFRRRPDGRYAILPEIRQRVTFTQMNLVEDVFPSLTNDTNAMDLIFCRNVLMYFSNAQMRKVIGNLRRSLVDGGWLAVSPSESSHVYFDEFVNANLPGVILYRREDAQGRRTATEQKPSTFWPEYAPSVSVAPWNPPPTESVSPPPAAEESAPLPGPREIALEHYRQGRYGEVVDVLLAEASEKFDAEEYSLLVRALANQGQLTEALLWCDRWLAADKLDFSGHYLRASVMQELGDREEARRSLQRAIYLQPDLILAHFALGNLARAGGRTEEAAKHFANALQALRQRASEEVLPESDGLTVGRLTGIISSLLSLEPTS